VSFYTWAWLFWLAFFVTIEGSAIFRKARGDTLSEHVWAWFQIRDKPAQWTWRRIVLAGFLCWLLVHMVAGF
jgi:hypothetical protein